MSQYLDRLFDRAADRVADRLADRVADRVEARLATLEVLADEEALEDLHVAGDAGLVDYDEVRGEVGLA